MCSLIIFLSNICFSLHSNFASCRRMRSQIPLVQATLLLVLVTSGVRSAKWYRKHEVHCKPLPVEVPIQVIGCYERVVNLKQCVGNCLSLEHSSRNKICHCCKPVQFQKVTVSIACPSTGNDWIRRQHVVKQHTECSCLECLHH